MLTTRLGGFNNLVLVIPPPVTANRHGRRKAEKAEKTRRDK